MRRTAVTLGALACLVAACSAPIEGRPVAEQGSGTATTTTTDGTPSSTAAPTFEQPGVKETLREPIPPNAFLCFPKPGTGVATPAQIADPAAPRLTVSVPDGWTSTPGAADVALNLAGPEGMSGSVTIAPTDLDPAAAFKKYGDDIIAKFPVSAINLWPAEFCGYSGQKLFGTLSDPPDAPLQFSDRTAHIWTNTKNYLVAVHLQAPSGAAGFDAAKDVLMQEFAIVIP